MKINKIIFVQTLTLINCEKLLLGHKAGLAMGRPDRGEKIGESVPSPRRGVTSSDSIDLPSSESEENQHLLYSWFARNI